MMKKYRLILTITGILAGGLGCLERGGEFNSLPYYSDSTLTPEWLAPSDPAWKNIHQTGAFSLINQDGDTITDQTIDGKIVVVDFFFTFCPGICPKLTNHMRLIQDAFEEEEEVTLLSHTVTPWADSVPVLKMYAESQGVKTGKWHLLTGNKDEIYRLAREEYFADDEFVPNKSGDFLHTENFVLLDKKGRIRGVYNGTLEVEVKQIIDDIEILKNESDY